MDGRSAGVDPALASGNASLLDSCEVMELRASDGRISAVEVKRGDEIFTLKARIYVLAAGAFGSPRVLLSSPSSKTDNIANSSGWVGRGLMFHLHENFALWPKRQGRYGQAGKSFCMRDLYFVKGHRLGIVQAMGLDAAYGNIVHYLNGLFDRSFLRNFPALRNLTRIPALIGARLFGQAKIFVGLMEDLGYYDNRVFVHPEDPEILAFEYTIHEELRARRTIFKRHIRKAFRGHRKIFLGFRPELDFGHASGTLRFGNDPATSVLDRDCKAHDLENLYVADASFMPSSMGVNPSLTIAANALRVSDIIIGRLKDEEKP